MKRLKKKVVALMMMCLASIGANAQKTFMIWNVSR